MANILIVGKHSPERDGLSLVMELAKHRQTAVESIPAALNLIQRDAYDLVLADSSLGGSSEQIVQQFKTPFPRTAVLVLADDAEASYGAERVITGPFLYTGNVDAQSSVIQRGMAFSSLLPKQESLRRLSTLPQTAAMFNRLAVLYHCQRRFVGAERLYKKALKLTEKASGSQHHEVATILNNLARLYHDLDRLAEAEALYRRSLAIVDKVFGPNHAKAARRLSNLVDLYHAQGMDEAVAPLYERLKALEESQSNALAG